MRGEFVILFIPATDTSPYYFRLQFETLPEMLCGLQYIISATTRLHLGSRPRRVWFPHRPYLPRASVRSLRLLALARAFFRAYLIGLGFSVRPSVRQCTLNVDDSGRCDNEGKKERNGEERERDRERTSLSLSASDRRFGAIRT